MRRRELQHFDNVMHAEFAETFATYTRQYTAGRRWPGLTDSVIILHSTLICKDNIFRIQNQGLEEKRGITN
jgi:hypothetical protein